MKAYVLIVSHDSARVKKVVSKLPQYAQEDVRVEEITGPYDVLVTLTAPTLEALSECFNVIRTHDAVERLVPCVVL